MAEPSGRKRWRPSRTNLIAGGLVIAGFLLTEVSWWFLLLAAAGTFGPGILREMGWLRDKDEFQRRAHYRAAYHAFLAVGLLAFVLVAFFRSGGTFEHPHRLATSFLALLWFTWFLSSLLSYWGAQKTAARLLIVFPVAIALIFLLLYLNFRNAADSLIVMLSVPFALIGGVWLVWLLGYDMSVAVRVGFLALFGVAAETSIGQRVICRDSN